MVVEADLQIDGNQTDNQEGLAAKGVEDLLNGQTLNVGGVDRTVQSVAIGSVVCELSGGGGGGGGGGDGREGGAREGGRGVCV